MEDNKRRRFPTVAAFVNELGGDKSHVIEKVLIANNGVAAVKAIRSIRRWAYDIFGDEKAIQFVVMATPEDLRANAEYIRMADVIVDVPGGSNNHNYANVTLIVELARLHGVHAVWAGWGHASENPALPDALAASDPPIKFIGPAAPPMKALGDKIGSTIIAQTAGVPCIGWNGEDVIAHYNKETGCLPNDSFDKACVKTSSEAYDAAKAIGFPVMIKASEGGGGKGIRMVDNPDDVQNAYRQVGGEVPGSPIFIMKLSSNSRHLEVQLIADEYGNAVALNGRDCSVQRRHQKIIEEGPPIAAPPDVWLEMEKAAIALAKAVGYANAGTVEYLYSEKEEKFYFLELNPRLQVEHPVTEMITKTNLPATQLQIAMGIKLYNIPDIRELYGKHRFEDDYSGDNTVIDFDTTPRLPPYGHCIAVRITAENAEAGFKPTSGGIQELNFRSTPSVWGYFSMDSSGSIHEFADSQFGHLFANGADREEARRNMFLALKELSIRGDISTTVDYISKLIELDDYIHNDIDTQWLDGLIQENFDGMGSMKRKSSYSNIEVLEKDLSAVIGAIIVACDQCTADEKQFLEALQKGQLPSPSLLSMVRNVELILDGMKYRLRCARNGPNRFSISLRDVPEKFIQAHVRLLSDGGFLTDINGKSRVAYLISEGDAANGMRISIGGVSVSFSPDYDPTSLRTDVAGKLVKKLVADGEHVNKGDPFCEIEVMKMFMPLKVSESGIIKWQNNEGAALAPGDLIASLELDNPESVATPTIVQGDLQIDGWGVRSYASSENRPHLLLRKAFEILHGGMSGYMLGDDDLGQVMDDLLIAVTDPMLPVSEVVEALSVLSGRIDGDLYENLTQKISNYTDLCSSTSHPTQLRFPFKQISKLISEHGDSIQDSTEKTNFINLTKPLVEAASPYANSNAVGVWGAERALKSFLDILKGWIQVERNFCDGKPYSVAVDNLRKTNKENYNYVLEMCRAHAQLGSTSKILIGVIDAIADALRVDTVSATSRRISIVSGATSLGDAVPYLVDIGSMDGNETYASVSLKARKLLLQESSPSMEHRKIRIARAVKQLSDSSATRSNSTSKEVTNFINENVPISDVFYSLLKSSYGDVQKMTLAELYLRKLYRAHTLKEFIRNHEHKVLRFTFTSKPIERPTTPGVNVSSVSSIIKSPSLLNVSDELSPLISRVVVCKMVGSIKEIDSAESFEKLLHFFPQSKKVIKTQDDSINVLYIIVTDQTISPSPNAVNALSEKLHSTLSAMDNKLEQAGIRRVSFILNYDASEPYADFPLPAILTFKSRFQFKEDALFRNIEPSNAYLLDLTRLEKNFDVRRLASCPTTTGNVHLFQALPRKDAVEAQRSLKKSPRIFVRALSFILEFSTSNVEKMLVSALNVLDVFIHEKKSATDNHLFMNFIGDYEMAVLDPAIVQQSILPIMKDHWDKVSALGVTEVETKLVFRPTTNSSPVAYRIVVSNPTGYVHEMNSFVEAVHESSSTPIFKLVGKNKTSLGCGQNVAWPYPLEKPFDKYRKAALRSSDSLYCYDLPALFEAAVEEQWNGANKGDNTQTTFVNVTELVVQKKDDSTDAWTMNDYHSNNLKLTLVKREAGLNNVGMVAWLMTLRTVEYPDGRQVILIANDITYKAGSFGTKEDVVFKLASEYAREHCIPRLFVAANSGARIGLAEGVKKKFQVGFKDSSKPENGFDFLYVSKEDYESLNEEKQQLIVEETTYNGSQVYAIKDIIGSEPDLGVENLKGSGLIAGETSTAYNEIFTMTIVLGRTVGIGAYLVRLGQRTIQKSSSSPIILTGYQALNKLMGVDVYLTNDQLGGPEIMYSNGVSHLTAKDHLSSVTAAIKWLSFVPCSRGKPLPISNMSGIDIIDRQIDFTPLRGVPYDPRLLLTGMNDDKGEWVSGFFDKGSFVETLAGWAKTVVVGRARLGGIPIGVIATENRTSEAIKPADPADTKASESVIQEAGCVWFPNSAYKTAQAINDFRTEDLPLIVFANWRGFSGGQRDMFDEVLKYGSLIVDAFVSYQQPVFVFIPPFAEVRGGAWVVLDASINSSVMEMYASSDSARGGVLEANGAASVKYRQKDLLKTMNRLDQKLKDWNSELKKPDINDNDRANIVNLIAEREKALLPVYGQIAVQFCDLHDTPGRMKAMGVIEKQVEWSEARSFFYWRLRRKLSEFEIRKQIVQASGGGSDQKACSLDASMSLRNWFIETPGNDTEDWNNDKKVLSWMNEKSPDLEQKMIAIKKERLFSKILDIMNESNECDSIATFVEGITNASSSLGSNERELFQKLMGDTISSSSE